MDSVTQFISDVLRGRTIGRTLLKLSPSVRLADELAERRHGLAGSFVQDLPPRVQRHLSDIHEEQSHQTILVAPLGDKLAALVFEAEAAGASAGIGQLQK